MNIYGKIVQSRDKKQVVVLIDPDKHTLESLIKTVGFAVDAGVNYFFVGGSLVSCSISPVVDMIKNTTDIPVILFPGSISQLSERADAVLLLSLISGRNPDMLIGNHVQVAPLLRQMDIETIPTGYMLIDGGKRTSVEYMSGTVPIPHDKPDIAVATAIAGEMLGLRLIYLEAGSGAKKPVCAEMIRRVRKNTAIPIIVGGGLRTKKDIGTAFDAGADIVVLGTIIEQNPEILKDVLF